VAVDADVLVVGAGVIGLTTAICLAEAGLSVTVAAAEPPAKTTSVAAGALWGPHLVGVDDRIARWAGVTLERLTDLSSPALGANELAGIVRTVSGLTASAKPGDEVPEHAAASAVTPCAPVDLPAGYRTGWRLTAPVIAMPEYLDYLARRLGRAGGTITFPPAFGTLADAHRYAPAARVVVNASGSGARDLVPDPEVVPVRGQVVVVRNPGISEFFTGVGAERWELTYLFPHRDVVVLGGTEQFGNASREPDPSTAAQIVAACVSVRPELAGAPVIEHRVGLRPARPQVRLEAEQLATGAGDTITVVHSYGHGGSGVTLSWGCAEDATALVLAALA
jgi:D-amino-acid oxidase